MILTSAGDWNVGFFRKNGYLLRGELKDVPKGHDCYELYKMIENLPRSKLALSTAWRNGIAGKISKN